MSLFAVASAAAANRKPEMLDNKVRLRVSCSGACTVVVIRPIVPSIIDHGVHRVRDSIRVHLLR